MMRYLQVFEKWGEEYEIDPSLWEQSCQEDIICPFCLEIQDHFPPWIVCKKSTGSWDCDYCGKTFYIDKICTYNTFKPNK